MRNSISFNFMQKGICEDTLHLILSNTLVQHEDGFIPDTSIHGMEYRIAHIRELNPLTLKVESICSEVYGKRLHTSDFWLSTSDVGTTVMSHDHLDGKNENILSAVLYLQADKNCGELFLEDYCELKQCTVGELVVFDSSCKHSVNENRSERPRTCIAFDMKLYK